MEIKSKSTKFKVPREKKTRKKYKRYISVIVIMFFRGYWYRAKFNESLEIELFLPCNLQTTYFKYEYRTNGIKDVFWNLIMIRGMWEKREKLETYKTKIRTFHISPMTVVNEIKSIWVFTIVSNGDFDFPVDHLLTEPRGDLRVDARTTGREKGRGKLGGGWHAMIMDYVLSYTYGVPAWKWSTGRARGPDITSYVMMRKRPITTLRQPRRALH